MVSMIQVGLDIAPTTTQIATWKDDCADYNRTRTAWEEEQQPIAEFNALLTSHHLETIKVAPPTLSVEACSFGGDTGAKAAR